VGAIWQPIVGLPYAFDLHHCAASTAGTVFCWGSNNYGQLGDSSTVDRAVPAMVPGLTDIASVTAGGIHSCALTHDGTAYCWGWNARGQLGIGSHQDHVTAPMRVLSAP
jgi:alpha-tubulin suppressor-like RCC1 family protein